MWGEEGIFKSFKVHFGHFLKNIKAYFNVQIKNISILTSDVENTEVLDHFRSLPLSNSQDLRFQNVCKCWERKDPGSDLPCLMEERGRNRLRLFEVKGKCPRTQSLWNQGDDGAGWEVKVFLLQGSQRVDLRDHHLR